MHKPTISRGRLGGMRGAIKSAATVYGEHGRAKLLVRILSDSFQFLTGTKTGQAHSAGQPIACHRRCGTSQCHFCATSSSETHFRRPNFLARSKMIQDDRQDPRDGTEDDLKMAQVGPKTPKMNPKMAQDGPKMAPRWPQVGQSAGRSVCRSVQNGTRNIIFKRKPINTYRKPMNL